MRMLGKTNAGFTCRYGCCYSKRLRERGRRCRRRARAYETTQLRREVNQWP